MVVRDQLGKMGIKPVSISLGEVVLNERLTDNKKKEVGEMLISFGFELIDDKRKQLIEKVKNTIIELVHQNNNSIRINLSDYISDITHHDYSYISNLFSEVENTTIEKYFIAQKIERVKELLVYDELSLSEIADLLNYSSPAHLSAQFKKVTGLTPSYFKQIKENKRKPLDKI
jgi:AraC-like DNA-binding protein